MRSIQKAFYKLFDSFSAAQLLAIAMSTILLGIGIFLVLDSAEETPGTNLNFPVENDSKQDNNTLEFEINQTCENGTIVYGNETDLVDNNPNGVYCKL